jgi:hypothetical protein
MKLVSLVLLVLALGLGVFAYRSHQESQRIDAERFAPNPDGTVTVELFGPNVRSTNHARMIRNVLIAGSALSAIGTVGCFVAILRKRKAPV